MPTIFIYNFNILRCVGCQEGVSNFEMGVVEFKQLSYQKSLQSCWKSFQHFLYLSPKQKPTGEDEYGAGVDDADPDQKKEVFWAARKHFPLHQQAESCHEYLKLLSSF